MDDADRFNEIVARENGDFQEQKGKTTNSDNSKFMVGMIKTESGWKKLYAKEIKESEINSI